MTQLQQDQQDVADAEKALAALGSLSSANFDQAFKLLRKRRNALDDIAKIQQEQFYQDAFNLISQAQSAGQGDKVVIVSQFLRQFAEYIATQTQSLQATYSDIKSIVDHIGAMGGGS